MASSTNGIVKNLTGNSIRITYCITGSDAMSEGSSEREFIRCCEKYSDAHGFGELDSMLLENSFVIPLHGVWVDHPFFHDLYRPLLYPYCPKTVFESLIGTYCYKDGVTIFVYRDGRTYVTKGKEIIAELANAGYREAGLYVPFCRDEVIRDSHLRDIWESVVEL